MQDYKYFIGIDIAKEKFDISLYNPLDKSSKNESFSNNKRGFSQFLKYLKQDKSDYFITLEATGGYEEALLFRLAEEKYAVSRIPTLTSSHYMRSLRLFAKNDVIDADALARLGAERHHALKCFVPPEKDLLLLQKLSMRRNDLQQFSTAEKQRLKHPNYDSLEPSVTKLSGFLKDMLSEIEEEISKIIENNEKLREKRKILTEFKGIGVQTSAVLLTVLPELGQLTRRQIASLAGALRTQRKAGHIKAIAAQKEAAKKSKKPYSWPLYLQKHIIPSSKYFMTGLSKKEKRRWSHSPLS